MGTKPGRPPRDREEEGVISGLLLIVKTGEDRASNLQDLVVTISGKRSAVQLMEDWLYCWPALQMVAQSLLPSTMATTDTEPTAGQKRSSPKHRTPSGTFGRRPPSRLQ